MGVLLFGLVWFCRLVFVSVKCEWARVGSLELLGSCGCVGSFEWVGSCGRLGSFGLAGSCERWGMQ